MEHQSVQHNRPLRFLALLVIIFIVLDQILLAWGPSHFRSAGTYELNDFEITQVLHPEKVWDRAFFGTSDVYADYVEEESTSGYVDAGLDDGVITDLKAILQRGYMKPGTDLVIGVDYLTFYDDLFTDPSYLWQRKWCEPYAYFARDRWQELFGRKLHALLGEPEEITPADLSKGTYYGQLSEEDWNQKIQRFDSLFWHLPKEDFRKNLDALEWVIRYCRKHNIRLRLVWMPRNPKAEKPEIFYEILNETKEICGKYGVEVLDLTDSMDAEYFNDVNHLSTDYGDHVFTKEIDSWLNQ